MGGLFENPLHLVLLIVVIVLLFGATKLGDVGGALGKSIREFKKEASREDELKAARLQSSQPTAGYVPPVAQSYGYQPDATQSVPQAPPVSYAPAEAARRPDVAPGDYRPAAPPQMAPPAASPVPPDYSGR